MRGITVNHKTVVVKTVYGAHPRLAKSITERAWNTLEARIHSRDCCAIGECGLDYTEPTHSLPGQRQLFQQQVTLAHQLKKPHVFHLRGNNKHSVRRHARGSRHTQGQHAPQPVDPRPLLHWQSPGLPALGWGIPQ